MAKAGLLRGRAAVFPAWREPGAGPCCARARRPCSASERSALGVAAPVPLCFCCSLAHRGPGAGLGQGREPRDSAWRWVRSGRPGWRAGGLGRASRTDPGSRRGEPGRRGQLWGCPLPTAAPCSLRSLQTTSHPAGDSPPLLLPVASSPCRPLSPWPRHRDPALHFPSGWTID